jgi:hypothetical protein
MLDAPSDRLGVPNWTTAMVAAAVPKSGGE